MKTFLKKFVSVSLILASVVSFPQNLTFALNAKCTKGASREISAVLHKPETPYPWQNSDMTGFCLGVIEAKVKKPENLLQNTELQLQVKPVGKYFYFFPKRRNVNTFKINGPSRKTDWYNIPERIINYIFSRCVKVDYRLVPISSAQAKLLMAKPVKMGEKRIETQDNERFQNEIEKVNGKNKAAELSEALLKKALDGLNDPQVDAYDPFDVVGNGNILKYADYKAPMTQTNYYSKKEAEEKNKKLSLEKGKVCDEFARKSGEDLKGFGEIGTLSTEKPVQYFAVVVNNFIMNDDDENGADYKAEAYKISQLLAHNGIGTFGKDKSTIEFDAKKIFTMPEAGVPSDYEQIDKVSAEVKSTLYKPGFWQWSKDKIGQFYRLLEKVLPRWFTDTVEIITNSLKRKGNEVPLAEENAQKNASQQNAAGNAKQGNSMSAEFLRKASEIALNQAETNRAQQEALRGQQPAAQQQNP